MPDAALCLRHGRRVQGRLFDEGDEGSSASGLLGRTVRLGRAWYERWMERWLVDGPGRDGDLSDVLLVLWHGAGGDLNQEHLVTLARAAAARGACAVRARFPYRIEGRRMPDRMPKLIVSARETIAALSARGRLGGGGRLPLRAGRRTYVLLQKTARRGLKKTAREDNTRAGSRGEGRVVSTHAAAAAMRNSRGDGATPDRTALTHTVSEPSGSTRPG